MILEPTSWSRQGVRTKLAQLMYEVSGQLHRVKYTQPYYAMPNLPRLDDVGEEEYNRLLDEWLNDKTPSGYHKTSWPFAMTVMLWSEKIDPHHWDHWALQHEEERCGPLVRCLECGGHSCVDSS